MRAPHRIRDSVPPRRRRQVGLRRRVQRPRRCRQLGRDQEAAAHRSARWSRVPSSQPARRARAASPRRPLAAAEPAPAPPRSAPVGWCGGEHQPQAKPFPGVLTEGPERRSKTAAAATPERASELCQARMAEPDAYKFGGVWGGQERGSRRFILWPRSGGLKEGMYLKRPAAGSSSDSDCPTRGLSRPPQRAQEIGCRARAAARPAKAADGSGPRPQIP